MTLLIYLSGHSVQELRALRYQLISSEAIFLSYTFYLKVIRD